MPINTLIGEMNNDGKHVKLLYAYNSSSARQSSQFMCDSHKKKKKKTNAIHYMYVIRYPKHQLSQDIKFKPKPLQLRGAITSQANPAGARAHTFRRPRPCQPIQRLRKSQKSGRPSANPTCKSPLPASSSSCRCFSEIPSGSGP